MSVGRPGHPPQRRHSVSALVAALLVAVLTLPAVYAPPAVADGGIPPIGGGVGSPPDPGTGTPNLGGGSTVIVPPCDGCSWQYGSTPLSSILWDRKFYLNYPSDTVLVHVQCPPRNVDAGDGDWAATGASWVIVIDADGNPVGNPVVTCVYPPRPVDVPVWCTARLTGTITNTEGPAATRLMVTKTQTSAWSAARYAEGSGVTCAASESRLYVRTVMDALGLYAVDLTSRRLPCVQRSYPDAGRPDRVIRCGAPDDNHRQILGSVYCQPPAGWYYTIGPGAAYHRGVPPWSYNGCAQTNVGPVKCFTGDGMARYGGADARDERHPVQVLDDGVLRPFTFLAFRPRGLTSITAVTTELRYERGSPVRARLDINQTTASGGGVAQPFAAEHEFNRQLTGDVRSFPIGFMAPGVAGQPFTVRRISTVTGTARVRAVTVQSIDFASGAVATSTTWRTVPVTFSCSSPEAYVDVHRVRSSSN